MPTRMIVYRRDHLEAVPLVEGRRLEGECHQYHLGAAAPSCLVLRGSKELCAQSPVTLRLIHPELAQLTGAAPRVPADSRHDAIALVHEERQQLAVGDVGGPRVEL